MKDKNINSIITHPDETIDVEAITSEYPEGCFIARVNEDSFDEDVFELFHPEKDKEGWIEVIVGKSTKGSYVSDGQIAFISPDGEVHWTQDTAVKQAEDIVIVYNGEDANPLDMSESLLSHR